MIPFGHEVLAYFSHYGRTLAAWTTIESTMSLVAGLQYPEGMPRNMLGMGLTGVQGFNSKLQFVDRSITRWLQREEGVEGPLWHRWKEIAGDLGTGSGKRNHLAHWLTIPFEDNPTEGNRIALCPWTSTKAELRRMGPPSDAYTVVDFIRTQREFENLRVDLLNFAHRMFGLQEPLERFEKPEDHLPTIQEIVDQMHEELGHPRESAKERKRRQDAENAAASLEAHIHGKPTETHEPESG